MSFKSFMNFIGSDVNGLLGWINGDNAHGLGWTSTQDANVHVFVKTWNRILVSDINDVESVEVVSES